MLLYGYYREIISFSIVPYSFHIENDDIIRLHTIEIIVVFQFEARGGDPWWQDDRGGADCRLTGGAGEELRWDSLGRNNEGEPAVDLPVEPERSCDGTRPQIAQSGRGETIVPMAERGVHRRGKILRARFSYVASRRFFTKAVHTPKNNETQIVGRM
ncbi:hypothetical protein PROFUN_08657 [Planoprotostelium fungivorum]|uniref:Uncharacterized protein n=1 Tax=Planoprotostelium fungivorum TaxID=1890364 RepID=A0A2P6NJ30_9EUKA|nr:hypothetical protein PROFUN_08657 [Planoprotostelium fungivorum]